MLIYESESYMVHILLCIIVVEQITHTHTIYASTPAGKIKNFSINLSDASSRTLFSIPDGHAKYFIFIL